MKTETKNKPDSRLIERLKRIAALAEGGIGGERENAQKMLDELCAKYGVTADDLAERDVRPYHFRAWGEVERELLIQIVAFITQKNRVSYRQLRGHLHFELTTAEYIEVADCYEFYRPQIKREYKAMKSAFMNAFFHKHMIFAPSDPNRESKTPPADELAMIINLARAINSKQWGRRKKLEGGITA